MIDAPRPRSPARTALLVAAGVAALRGAAFFALGREVDDPVGGSLTIGYGLLTALLTGGAMFLCVWLALRRARVRAASIAMWILAALLGAWTLRTIVVAELHRQDYAAARAPDSAPAELRALDLDDDIIMYRLASNPASPPDVLRELAAKHAGHVATRLLDNPSTPDDVRAELTPRDGR